MLTEKQRAYVEARKSGKNQRESGLAAGYSEATVDQMASKLEKNEEVKRAMDEKDAMTYSDPKDFLIDRMNNDPDVRVQMDAAKSLLPYFHGKISEQGKKEGKQDRAEEAMNGKFRPRVVNG